MKWLAVPVALIAAAAFAYKVISPTYVYRYRLQLTLDIAGTPHTGSSVIEVSWSCGPKIADSGCAATLDGQATVIDLGSRGVLVATLHSGEPWMPISKRGTDAGFLCAKAFGNGSSHQELPLLSRVSGRRDLSSDNFPFLIWFPEAVDPKSFRRVTLENISSTIDSSAHFTAAYVEITNDPIVINIERKLPWLPALVNKQKGKGITTWPGRLQLIYNMFLGADS